jgi:hypothetical protein
MITFIVIAGPDDERPGAILSSSRWFLKSRSPRRHAGYVKSDETGVRSTETAAHGYPVLVKV